MVFFETHGPVTVDGVHEFATAEITMAIFLSLC